MTYLIQSIKRFYEGYIIKLYPKMQSFSFTRGCTKSLKGLRDTNPVILDDPKFQVTNPNVPNYVKAGPATDIKEGSTLDAIEPLV